MAERTSEVEFDRLADTIYEAMPEGQLYEALADSVATAVIADGWMSRGATGDAQAREADLIAGPLRRRLGEVEAERDDLESRLAALLCDLTDGRMSKTNYDVRTMVREVEAAFERHYGGDESNG